MKKIILALLTICGLSSASNYTALNHGPEKHYKIGEQVVIPISLDLFPEGETSFECLAPNEENKGITYNTDFVPNVLYAPGSNQIDFYVSQCQKVGKKNEKNEYIYKNDGSLFIDNNNWHNNNLNRWIEVLAKANTPGVYEGSISIYGTAKSGRAKVSTNRIGFKFFVDAPESFNVPSGIAVQFADSAASYDKQIDLNLKLINASGSDKIIKKNSYVDYYLTKSENEEKPKIDVWYNPLGSNACIQVYKCEANNFLIREYILNNFTLGNNESLVMPQVGYREHQSISGDKTEGGSGDFSYSAPSLSYESKSRNRNMHYENKIAMYSEGTRIWGSSPNWVGSCLLATSSDYTIEMGASNFCNETPIAFYDETDGKDTIYEGEGYFFKPNLSSTIGVKIELEPVGGVQSPLNWINVGTPVDYWSGDYYNQNNNINTTANRRIIYVYSHHGSDGQRPSVPPGVYKYKMVLKDSTTSAELGSIIRTIVVKKGADHPESIGKKVAVLMGDETWFKPYQLDVATGIVNYSTESVDLSNFRYEYYGQIEDKNADITNVKYLPHPWYPSNPNTEILNVSFAECGEGRFRVRYQYKKSLILLPSNYALDYKTGFVYGSTEVMQKTDDYSLSYFDEDPPRRRYNPNMPLFDKNNKLLWGSLPSWANQCADYIAPSSSPSEGPHSSSSSIPKSSSSFNIVARSSSSFFSEFHDLAVRFRTGDTTTNNQRSFWIDVINKGNKTAQIGGYTARFYYNDETVPDSAKLKFNGSSNQNVSEATWEQCDEHLFAANFKFASNAIIEPNRSFPSDGGDGIFYLENVHETQGNLLDVSSFDSWMTVSEMTENQNMALFDAQGNLVFGGELWPCKGYTKKKLKLVVKGNVKYENRYFEKINKSFDNAAARVNLVVENKGDSIVSGPIYIDFQVKHPTGPIIDFWGNKLTAAGSTVTINDNTKITRLSAGNIHTFRFVIRNGIGAANSENAQIYLNFLMYDQCVGQCKAVSEVTPYLWNLYDDWSAQGIINVPNIVETGYVTIYNSENKILHGIADPSAPVYEVGKKNNSSGNGNPSSLTHNHPVIGIMKPNRTDAIVYSGGQLLSGGDFESPWYQGWSVYEPDSLHVVRSIRGNSPQGSRHISLMPGTSITQELGDVVSAILADSGAVLMVWHKGDSANIKLNNSTIVCLHKTYNTWAVDTVYIPKANFNMVASNFISIFPVNSGDVFLDDMVLAPYHKAQPSTYATRFTNTSGEELETRAYDGDKDQLVTTSERDAMGRLSKKYLPFQMDCNSVEDCNSNLKTLYNPSAAKSKYIAKNPDYPDAGGHPYVETQWKPDPLATKDVEGAPGTAFSIISNHVARTYSSGVSLFGIDLFDLVSLNSAVKAVYNDRTYSDDYGNKANYHAAKDTNPTHLWELHLDQNGNAAFTVKDGEGHVIISGGMKKTGEIVNGGVVYEIATRSVSELDARGNVTVSHPPMSCSFKPTTANCVAPDSFFYDSQSRVIRTVEPDAGESRTYYDFAGRVRASQTQRQIDSGTCSVVGYDHLDRTVFTGEWKCGSEETPLREKFMRVSAVDSPFVEELTPGTVTRTFYDRMPARDTLGVELYPQGIVSEPAYIRGRIAAVISDVRAVVNDNGDTLKTSDGKDSVIRVSSANSYDKYGRVVAGYSYDPTLPDSLKQLWTTTQYDLGGKVISTTKYPYGYSFSSVIDRNVKESYVYDRLGRVSKILSSYGNTPETELARYEYYPTGSVKTVTLGNSLTLSYTYHISGAMKTATVMSADNRELYSDTLYFEDCGGNGCMPQYNGNISRMAHHLVHGNGNYGEFRDVQYTYDELNRLIKVDDSKQDVFDEIFAYDAQGRITAQRRGNRVDSARGGEYGYYEGKNRLKSVAGNIGGTADTRKMDVDSNFVYDSEGNLTEDKSKGLKILYDWRGMPIEFIQQQQPTGSSGSTLFRLTMSYDGSGRRISKTSMRKVASNANWDTTLVTHYTGIGTEIRESFTGPTAETKVVVNMPNGLGRYGIEAATAANANASQKFEWYLKNHLGSTMLVYGTVASTNPNEADIGEKIAAYDYRSFGEMVELTPPPTGKVTENFTGKEHDDEIALDYFGARYLDPMLGLWTSVDPKREYFSPYIYLRGDPVNLVDPTGMAEADSEIKKISPRAFVYINTFEPEDYELDVFLETYDRFVLVGLTKAKLRSYLSTLPVKHGEYPPSEDNPNPDPDKYNGYYNKEDKNAIRITKKGLTINKEWKLRIRSTIFHEFSHRLNYAYGLMIAEELRAKGIKVDKIGDVMPYPNDKYYRPGKNYNTHQDLGAPFEVNAYGKNF